MADILLAHSYHLPYDPKQVRKMQPYPPLGTLYAAAALREHGFSAAVFDPMLQDPVTGFLEMLRQEKPAVRCDLRGRFQLSFQDVPYPDARAGLADWHRQHARRERS